MNNMYLYLHIWYDTIPRSQTHDDFPLLKSRSSVSGPCTRVVSHCPIKIRSGYSSSSYLSRCRRTVCLSTIGPICLTYLGTKFSTYSQVYILVCSRWLPLEVRVQVLTTVEISIYILRHYQKLWNMVSKPNCLNISRASTNLKAVPHDVTYMYSCCTKFSK
jgi:hypothetical protein